MDIYVFTRDHYMVQGLQIYPPKAWGDILQSLYCKNSSVVILQNIAAQTGIQT